MTKAETKTRTVAMLGGVKKERRGWFWWAELQFEGLVAQGTNSKAAGVFFTSKKKAEAALADVAIEMHRAAVESVGSENVKTLSREEIRKTL